MATFNQWFSKKTLRRVTWLCGPEYVLKSEIIRAYREAVPALSTTLLFAGELTETEIWDQVLTMPSSGCRLVVVHGAEKLKDFGSFRVLAKAEGMDTAFAVFVSAEPDFARTGTSKKTLAPHLAAIQSSRDGQLIRCVAPGKQEDLLKIVVSWWPGSGANFAHDLMSRCDGNLALTREACLKAELAGLPPTAEHAETVACIEPARSFTDSVIAGDRKTAVGAAGLLHRSETGYALAVLATALGQLEALREAKSRGLPASEIASRLRLPWIVQHKLAPLASGYSPDRVRACRRLLAEAESAHRAGAASGVAEAVAVLW